MGTQLATGECYCGHCGPSGLSKRKPSSLLILRGEARNLTVLESQFLVVTSMQDILGEHSSACQVPKAHVSSSELLVKTASLASAAQQKILVLDPWHGIGGSSHGILPSHLL